MTKQVITYVSAEFQPIQNFTLLHNILIVKSDLKGHSPDNNYDYCRNIEFFSWWAPFKCCVKEIFCLWSWLTSLHWPLLAEATQLNEQIFIYIYIYIYIYIWPLAEKRCSKAIPCLATSFGKLLRNKNSYFMAIKLWYLNFKE